MIKVSYIRKLPNGKFRVFSRKGKNMGTYNSRSSAKTRLREIEFFKRKKALIDFFDCIKIGKKEIDITQTYSSIMRELRKSNPDKVKPFMKAFKEAFDQAMENDMKDDIENIALLQAIQITGIE